MSAGPRPPAVAAILGPTASGKSALGLALAASLGGEIVACDSTAVYRGFDIGTDKVPPAEQEGIPHHCVDIVDPARDYTAADYARDAMAAIRAIHARGRLPILVGGTGFYYRALARGIFPGPGRDDRLRSRLEAIAARRGDRLHRMLARVDPPSAARIRPRDVMRVVRALEVYFQSGRTLTDHFADTRAPLAGWTIAGIVVHPPWEEIAARIGRRVEAQFARGIEDEVRSLLARGVPPTARPFTGYVYRRVLELVRGERDEASARDLIVRENRHYARRQLIWFRKEPNLVWIHRAGDRADTTCEARRIIETRLAAVAGPDPPGEHPRMSQSPDARTPAEANVQDAFLNLVRREHQAVHVRLMDGTEVEARVKSFDRFAVILEQDGADQLIFKHAIASIRASRSTAAR